MSDNDNEAANLPPGPIFTPTEKSIPFYPDEEGEFQLPHEVEDAQNNVMTEILLQDDHVIHLIQLLLDQAVIAIGPRKGRRVEYTDQWQYEDSMQAFVAVTDWADGLPTQREPEGWVRHTPSYRRRAHGDPSTETVRL